MTHIGERWYPLIPHPTQIALVNDDVRFKVAAAGRRSGKTERAKRFIIKKAYETPGEYFVAAPTYSQVSRIYWEDLKKLSMVEKYGKNYINSTVLRIRFPNTSTISLVGLDKPERIEGIPWAGGIIDEIANVKPSAWEEHIAPALDTYNPTNPKKAWCWLIGVPDGFNHFYDKVEYARTGGDPNWKFYTWKSSDILPSDTIESARRHLSLKQFRQEYEASFETAEGKIYEDYGYENCTEDRESSEEPLLWMHDFNYSPMSSAIAVRRGEYLIVVGEIVLNSAVARQAAIEFVEKYKDHTNKNVRLYGDPAGRAGEKHAHPSDYTEIEKVLRDNGWKVDRKVKASAPAIRDRQNAVRAKICSASGVRTFYVNNKTAPWVHKAMATVQIKLGSSFLEQESDHQHITTAIGYCVDYEWPVRAALPKSLIKPQQTVHYWEK